MKTGPAPAKNAVRLLLAAVLALGPGCGGKDMERAANPGGKASGISPEQWKRLSARKIYFGHQSVGNNIIAGLRDISSSLSEFFLPIVEGRDGSALASPAIAHSPIGENWDPFSKIEDFRAVMGAGVGTEADIAFFKFCYIDFSQDTDPAAVFESYRSVMAGMKSSYPETTFVHVTVPLTVVQRGLRAWVKNIIGRPIGGYAENIARNRYNDLLRGQYSGREPLFDLAGIEGTAPDGRMETFTFRGATYQALVPAYSHDGRHLNESGRVAIAEELLLFLAALP